MAPRRASRSPSSPARRSGWWRDSPQDRAQWERAVVLRMGRYVGLNGPRRVPCDPFVDTIAAWIDQRTVTPSFAAEQDAHPA